MTTLLVCVKIFFGRILDVSIGTVRTVISVKGQKFAASVLAFFEVFIWYYVARSALNTPLNSIFVPISYSLGYATGTFIGTTLSRKVIKGNTSIQVITSKASKTNLERIRTAGYGVTIIDVYDTYDNKEKKLLLMEVKNRNIKELTNLIKKIDEKAFITLRENSLDFIIKGLSVIVTPPFTFIILQQNKKARQSLAKTLLHYSLLHLTSQKS